MSYDLYRNVYGTTNEPTGDISCCEESSTIRQVFLVGESISKIGTSLAEVEKVAQELHFCIVGDEFPLGELDKCGAGLKDELMDILQMAGRAKMIINSILHEFRVTVGDDGSI